MRQERFNSLVLPIKDKMYRFARSLLKNGEDAQDVVQDAMLKLWNNRVRLDSVQNPDAWAMTITRNLCLDLLKSARNRLVSFEYKETPSYLPEPDRLLESEQTMQQVKQLMESLSEQQRAVIHLRDVEGYEMNEIAELLDMEINAVRVNLSRARKKVREQIQKMELYGYQEN